MLDAWYSMFWDAMAAYKMKLTVDYGDWIILGGQRGRITQIIRTAGLRNSKGDTSRGSAPLGIW